MRVCYYELMATKKSPRKLERHFKGVANHKRIEILLLIHRQQGITLEAIADALKGNIKTIAEHTRRLVHAGLVEKEYAGRSVQHSLTPYGAIFVSFIQTFSNSQESKNVRVTGK